MIALFPSLRPSILPYFSAIFSILNAVWICSCCLAEEVVLPSTTVDANYLIVLHDTRILDSPEKFGNAGQPGLPISADSLISGLVFIEGVDNRPPVWKVRTPDGYGFILASSVSTAEAEIQDWLKIEQATLLQDKEVSDKVPPSIYFCGKIHLRDAWREATTAIGENENLPEAAQIADPYLARAEVFIQANDIFAAIEDLRNGSAIAARAATDARQQKQIASIYERVIEKFLSVPIAVHDENISAPTNAASHYNSGIRLLRQQQFEKATQAFSSALAVRPSRAIYWYMRAISRYKEGHLLRAQSDALFGAMLERRSPPNVRKDIGRSLTHQQGWSRLWLEKYRRSDDLLF